VREEGRLTCFHALVRRRARSSPVSVATSIGVCMSMSRRCSSGSGRRWNARTIVSTRVCSSMGSSGVPSWMSTVKPPPRYVVLAALPSWEAGVAPGAGALSAAGDSTSPPALSCNLADDRNAARRSQKASRRKLVMRIAGRKLWASGHAAAARAAPRRSF